MGPAMRERTAALSDGAREALAAVYGLLMSLGAEDGETARDQRAAAEAEENPFEAVVEDW